MKPSTSWTIGILIVIVLGLVAAIVVRWTHVDRMTADTLSAVELEQYATRERLDLQRFLAAEVTENDGRWLYNFKYDGEPRHDVAIIVHRDGRTELTRMLEDTDR